MSSNYKQGSYAKRPNRNQIMVKVGQKFPLTIKRLGINGEGIGYFKHKIVFIPGALPGEVVTAKVTEVQEKYLQARVVTIRTASPDRVTPVDEFADQVGGFELEHLAYPAQLKYKEDLIRQALEKFQPKGWQDYTIKPALGMDNPYHYRNKVQFPVRKYHGDIIVGMFQRGSHDLVDLPDVQTQDRLTMKIVRQVAKILDELSVSIYNEDKNKGVVKTIVVRSSATTGQAQLTLITNQVDFPGLPALLEKIQTSMPEINGIFQNVNPGRQSLIWGEETFKLWGSDYLEEEILGQNFDLSPRAFLQLNYEQMLVAYEEALTALHPQATDRLVDAYAGVGTLGLSIARQVKEVRGMEIIPEAVADANHNAEINDIQNASYEAGTAEQILPKWQDEGWLPTALIVDPPRLGLDIRLKRAILKSQPNKMVYLSCNPSTLARDLVDLSKIYRVDYIQPIDMFPQTPRWEGVVKLSKRSTSN
ncbi:23S rRNA (uracil(1939)-C(5))-methyltransferase RlmD [Convivina praedatoris]|uniref:23S rRNA (Uracil-C(5))-methyltransferase RlmCD n=1 Tax=Convivina praedatoris TaxID=2880963 RepID=A0ABM9D586_9LACO|nr:23S rRNA (uracil(1939)-C(5))-methyltransferase RlmD [Convivina sp. LMG 32447]CAH1855355.1 23S rRNA (uracil-C(5))-methyltransferase RlmCD [Convivina sp. LMG 32447]CAH1856026.1 23S rRNA (uracil-C(5))-methyltransferase RlmCD [Convivina sp. LMG 32447]CAH1856411.1 23S rRNA (uracil-C(5))-methyltransferase RlmCD [Convivina sp. LMG 32447]